MQRSTSGIWPFRSLRKVHTASLRLVVTIRAGHLRMKRPEANDTDTGIDNRGNNGHGLKSMSEEF